MHRFWTFLAEFADIFQADFGTIICEREPAVLAMKAETLEIAAKMAHYGER